MSELDLQIEESLRALAPGAEGNWGDVVSRARRFDVARDRRRRRLVLAFSAVALVLVTGTALAIGTRLFDWFTVRTAPERAPTLPAAAPYVSGQTLYLAGRKPQHLASPLLASLLGQDVPLVVTSPRSRYIAYHSWRNRTPLLFVHDTLTDSDRLLARGAQTIVWGSDGRIAYVQADPPRYSGRREYVGRVMVRNLNSKPVAWTKDRGVYFVLAWARGRLLIASRGCNLPGCETEPTPGVYVLERSGRLVPLPLASLLALSPDGRLALGRHDPVPGQDSPSALVRLVDVASGRVLSTLDLTHAVRAAGLRGPLPGSLYTAAWRGDEIVGAFSGTDSALIFLRVRGGRLSAEQVVRIPAATLPGRYSLYFGAPVFTNDGTNRVVVPVRRPGEGNAGFAAVLACDRRSRHCVRGQMLRGREWFAVVSNPSRPAAGR
jgi:hypothetical protein